MQTKTNSSFFSATWREGTIAKIPLLALMLLALAVSAFALSVEPLSVEPYGLVNSSIAGVAGHTATITISPNAANCSQAGQTFTFNIANDVGSVNSINEVRIYQGSVPFADFACGPAPTGWAIAVDMSQGYGYCEYKETPGLPDNKIHPLQNLDFTFHGTAAAIPLACYSEFMVSTLDDAQPIGFLEYKFPKVFIDCTAPIVNKTIGTPLYQSNGNDYISQNTNISVTSSDNQACDQGIDHCQVSYTVNSAPQTPLDYTGEAALGFNFNFKEDSKHDVNLTCVDKAGNSTTVLETDFVETLPPVTTKTLGIPFYTNGISEWITTATPITLTAADPLPHPSGVKETWYLNTIDETEQSCANPTLNCRAIALPKDPKGEGWTQYGGTFTKNEESCHVLTFYSVDNLGQIENPKVNCFYVDTKVPVVEKIVGQPSVDDFSDEFVNGEQPAGIAGPAAVNLRSAGIFAILAKSGISTTGTTSIAGNIGVSPIDSTGMTGFGLILDASNRFATSSLVNGKAYAADYAPPTPSIMTTAVSDMETAYTDAAGRINPDATELGAGNIDGMTIAPGLYKWSTGVTIPTGVTLSGGPNDVWIFQIAQTLDVGNGAVITLDGGAQPQNIFWQVGSQATLGTTSDVKGIILSKTAIVMNTGAKLNGRALAQTAVTLDAGTVNAPSLNPKGLFHWVSPETPITFTCTDQQPHPSGGEQLLFKVSYDLADDGFVTEEYCTKYGGSIENIDGANWCVVPAGPHNPFEFHFNQGEDSVHDLEYFCRDAVNKHTEVQTQYYKVDATPPVISKEMIGDAHLGTCPPKSADDKCYVADNGENGVSVLVADGVKENAQTCVINDVSCTYRVLWHTSEQNCYENNSDNQYNSDNGTCLVDSGEFSDTANIIFHEDSTHDLVVSCSDGLGNKTTDTEIFLVDSTPPVTKKTYGEPFYSNDLSEWITSSTPISLAATDAKVGVDKTFYRVTLLDSNGFCINQHDGIGGPAGIVEPVGCNAAQGLGDFTEYIDDPFTIPQQSCHLIEFYSVDKLGNTEEQHRQCPFVDNSPPKGVKLIGAPHVVKDESGNICSAENPSSGSIGLLGVQENNSTPGFNLRQINGGYSQSCGINTGLAFDGKNLIVSCWGHNVLDFLSTSDGNLVGTLAIPGHSSLQANAWDATRNKLWQCAEHSNVLLVDTSDGSSTLYAHDGVSCTDGLAYDGTDDTLWISPDVSGTIYHYKINGDNTLTLIESKPLSGLIGNCGNSGIAVGGTNLYLANNGCSEIYAVSKNIDSSTLFSSFPRRLEDLECDDITFAGQGVGAIWSIDAYDRTINAWEIPSGLCGFGGLPPGNTCVGETKDFVSQATNFTLNCNDVLPHPVDHSTVCYKVSLEDDGTQDITGNYCKPNADGWCCSEAPIDFSFKEDTYHNIEYYCSDALGNSSVADLQLYTVDTLPPIITKTVEGPQVGTCPPKNADDQCIIDGVTVIKVDAVDQQPHPVDSVTCDWRYEVLDGQASGGQQGVKPPFEINFPEESRHGLWITCSDALGNKAEDYEEFQVDKTPPVTTKTYGDPFFSDHLSEWITSGTPITLSATDEAGPHVSGVKATYYRTTVVDNGYCRPTQENHDEPLNCEDAQGTGEFTQYSGQPFMIPEQSCHLIEYYSVDNVNKTEQVKKQCTFVDNAGPTPVKTVGEPSDKWTPGKNGQPNSIFYPQIKDLCWNGQENGIDCWKVTLLTPITMSCTDPQPHPVNHSTMYFMVDFDGKDITAEYCHELGGDFDEQTGCHISNDEATIYFGEESEHNLKYYCVDALGNKGPVDDEKFKVEGKPFEIQLNKKWNLISVPFTLINSDPVDVFADVKDNVDAVWYFDAFTNSWSVFRPAHPEASDLDSIEPGNGYWLAALNPDTLTLGGSLFSPAVTPPSKPIKKGWNLIGYYGPNSEGSENPLVYEGPLGKGKEAICELFSLTEPHPGEAWSSLLSYWESFNPNQWSYQWTSPKYGYYDNLDAGAGYWVNAKYDGEYNFSTVCGLGP